jgi:HAD superfamily hydrolase (TIGR01490 family)
MQEKRPFAVFDIDGTLIRWQLYHAVADQLAKQGHLKVADFAKVKAARMAWKKREQAAAFRDYEEALVTVIDQAITGIIVSDLQAVCQTVIDEYKDQVYIYTRDLVAHLKQQNYLLFVISASQSQIVELLAEYYGFDDFGGSTYEIKDGYFTGQKEVMRRDNKPILLEQLVEKHQATYQGSIAVGDSESDIPMLEAVEQPIAFNPTKLLFETATRHNWKIIIERKSMWYELKGSDGSYVLAQTNA